MRKQAEMKKRERELGQRREAAAGEHRQVADTRQQEADKAEREARMAQKEAERQRAEAELHQERASMHESGEADHELIDENERDRFAGTSADVGDTPRGETETGRTGATGDSAETTGTPTGSRSEFEQGREVGHEEERSGGNRFDRDETPSGETTPGSRRA